MIWEQPPIEDAIVDIMNMVLSRQGPSVQTRMANVDKIRTLQNVPRAGEILARTPYLVRNSIISDIGYGVDPSNIVALLDLVERAGIPWDKVNDSWPGNSSGLSEHSIWMADLFNNLIPEQFDEKIEEISAFYHHQNSMTTFNLRTNRISDIFIRLFFTVYADDAADILHRWSQNHDTGMLVDLINLADNWREYKDVPSAWAFSILGVTSPVRANFPA